MKLVKAPEKSVSRKKSRLPHPRVAFQPQEGKGQTTFPDWDEGSEEVFRRLVDRLGRGGRIRGHAL
jgi:hypothetical protein